MRSVVTASSMCGFTSSLDLTLETPSWVYELFAVNQSGCKIVGAYSNRDTRARAHQSNSCHNPHADADSIGKCGVEGGCGTERCGRMSTCRYELIGNSDVQRTHVQSALRLGLGCNTGHIARELQGGHRNSSPGSLVCRYAVPATTTLRPSHQSLGRHRTTGIPPLS